MFKNKGINFRHLNAGTESIRKKSSSPETVVIPLKQGFGAENNPLVEKGDWIKAGDTIGTNDDYISTPVHSSVSGEVLEIVEIGYIHEYLKEPLEEPIKGIKIKVDGTEVESKGEGIQAPWSEMEPEEVRDLLYLSGVSALGQTGIPTGLGSSPGAPEDIEEIIVNAVETEPFIYPRVSWSQEREEYLQGLHILSRAFPKATVHLAIEKEIIKSKEDFLSQNDIKLHPIETTHPWGDYRLLLSTLLNIELSYGEFPIEKGLLVLPGEAPLIVYQAIKEGKPFINKRVSIGGAFSNGVAIDVPIGTSLKHILSEFSVLSDDCSFILGGPLTGFSWHDLTLPVGKELDSIVILEHKKKREFVSWFRPGRDRKSYSRMFLSSILPAKEWEVNIGLQGEERPCISCGSCSEVCPVNILPYQINRTFSHDLIDETLRLDPQKCIDCGLCSYVCPTKQPTAARVKAAKREFINGSDHVVYSKCNQILVTTNWKAE